MATRFTQLSEYRLLASRSAKERTPSLSSTLRDYHYIDQDTPIPPHTSVRLAGPSRSSGVCTRRV